MTASIIQKVKKAARWKKSLQKKSIRKRWPSWKKSISRICQSFRTSRRSRTRNMSIKTGCLMQSWIFRKISRPIKTEACRIYMEVSSDRSAPYVQVHICRSQGAEMGELQIYIQPQSLPSAQRSVYRDHPDLYRSVYHHTDGEGVAAAYIQQCPEYSAAGFTENVPCAGRCRADPACRYGPVHRTYGRYGYDDSDHHHASGHQYRRRVRTYI